jgi:hypothetical protein
MREFSACTSWLVYGQEQPALSAQRRVYRGCPVRYPLEDFGLRDFAAFRSPFECPAAEFFAQNRAQPIRYRIDELARKVECLFWISCGNELLGERDDESVSGHLRHDSCSLSSTRA